MAATAKMPSCEAMQWMASVGKMPLVERNVLEASRSADDDCRYLRSQIHLPTSLHLVFTDNNWTSPRFISNSLFSKVHQRLELALLVRIPMRWEHHSNVTNCNVIINKRQVLRFFSDGERFICFSFFQKPPNIVADKNGTCLKVLTTTYSAD